MKQNFKSYYNSVVRVTSYNNEFDFSNPQNKGKNGRSSGSAFFIDSSGTLLTCAHVVDRATKVTINIPSKGREEYDAKVLGICPYFDVAMMKVESLKGTVPLKMLKNDKNLHPGSTTYALGYPLGNQNLKITKGILSGQQELMYQTDTPINPGNSGGPLIQDGKVIGINAAGILLADNIGFAVPIHRVFLMMSELSKPRNLIHYPSLMFSYQLSNPDFKICMKDKCKGGVIITKIFDHSLLRKKNIQEGDVLCRINDVQIDYYSDMNKFWMGQKLSIQDMLSSIKLNSNVKLEVWRNGKLFTESFKYAMSAPNIRYCFPTYEPVEHFMHAGMIFMNLSLNHLRDPDLRTRSNKKYLSPENWGSKKVILCNILLESIANTNIFRKGNIISKINDVSIETVDDVKKALKRQRKQARDSCDSYDVFKNEDNKILILNRKKSIENDDLIKKTYNFD